MLLLSLGHFLPVLQRHLSQFEQFVVRSVQLLLNSLPFLLQRGLCSFSLFQLPGQLLVCQLTVFSCTLKLTGLAMRSGNDKLLLLPVLVKLNLALK
jgi:hypothetical protein